MFTSTRRRRITASILALAAAVQGFVATGAAAFDRPGETSSPIKHVIYIIGENRCFDNVFATYVPKPGEAVANLLSKGIVNADGTPGPNFDKALQYQVTATDGKYAVAPEPKIPYATLPVPTVMSAPPVPLPVVFGVISASGTLSPQFPDGDPELPADEQDLLDSGGTGGSIALALCGS
jgi:phospholipase C